MLSFQRLVTWSVCRAVITRPAIVQNRCLTASAMCLKEHRDRRDLLRGLPKKIDGAEGETDMINVEAESKLCYRLPDENTPNEIFDGMVFSDIPILHIKCSKNNTLMALVDPKDGKIFIKRSCGTEGFKNCRKGTTVAAHTTGLAMASKMHKAGMKTCRLMVKGLGPGRMASVQGLVVGGVNIVSITDATPYLDRPPRPRAAKSI